MLLSLFGKIVRTFKYRAVQPTHVDLIENIIEDSGMCRDTLTKCINRLIYKTEFTTHNRNSLPKLFCHDLSLVERKHRGSLAFIFDELIENVLRYRKHVTAFEVYCLIGKCLNGK